MACWNPIPISNGVPELGTHRRTKDLTSLRLWTRYVLAEETQGLIRAV